MGSNAEGSLTVARARELLAGGFAALEERKQEINDLNVYPVPDGDTGTNLTLTVRGMAESLSKLPEDLSGPDVCSAISQAALMGARGNSGVILSQIVRGAMEVLGQEGPVTQDVLTQALCRATDTAYRAVRRPVEGTMLTVLREMAEAATQASDAADLRQFLSAVVAAGWKSVERTPTLLKVLADAGVVDAGGFGLVVLVEGTANGHAGAKTVIATHFTQPVLPAPAPEEEPEEEDSQFTYCTSFLLTGHGLDKDSLEQELGRLGDSLLVVGDDTQIKVHVHTDEPGTVIGIAGALGVLTEIEIDNMNEQKAARDRALGSAGADAASCGRGPHSGGGGGGRRGQQGALPGSGRRPHRRGRAVHEPIHRRHHARRRESGRSLGDSPPQQRQRHHDGGPDGRAHRPGGLRGAQPVHPGGAQRRGGVRQTPARAPRTPRRCARRSKAWPRRRSPGRCAIRWSTACR